MAHARRGKGRNMRLPVSPEGRLLARRPTTPIKLYSEQSWYVCSGVMPIGTMAVFSRNRRQWRHTTCSNPQD
jgi:hypothetical protein